MPKPLVPIILVLAASLTGAGEASAAACDFQGPGTNWHTAGNWSCGKVPDAADSATVGTSDSVTVAAAASAGTLSLASTATLTFSGGVTLAVSKSTLAGSLYVGSATLRGDGTVTVAGAFHKGAIPGGDTMFILDSVDLVLNGDSVMDGGRISICQAGDPPSDPTLHINADFTVAEGADSFSFFNCSSSGARIRVGPAGHLIKAIGGQATSDTAIDNDGTITVQTGTLLLKGGTAHALGAISDGDYLADAGAVLEFQGGSPPVFAGHIGGAGTIHFNTLDLEMLAGAVLDPAVLQHSGFIRFRGTAPVTLPHLKLTGGVFDSDRPIAVEDMDVTAGRLQRDFTLTVVPGGSFTKTTAGTFFVSNNGAFGSADLVLDADATLDDGQICVSRTGTGPDLPGVHINQDFTIGSAAPAGAFQCGPQFGTQIHLNGPDGRLSKVGSGTTNFNDLDLAGGTLSVASGQTFAFPNTYAQSGGVTEIASGGTLQAAPTLTGGVLRGGGQVSGGVTNTSGTVRPGGSPGTLTVTGGYAQGAAGVLEIDVDGTGQGSGHDHLAVSGAASLDGTVAVVNGGAGFDPTASDTFQFLTSTSRSGTFDALTGSLLPSGEGYALDYPGAPAFGSRLTVTTTPGSVVAPTLTDTDPDSFADDITPEVKGTAPDGSTVAIYTTPDCSGSPVAVGSAAAFASPGLTASVADNSTTSFRATATVDSDTSPCSASSIEYIEDSGPADVIVDASATQAFLDSLQRLRGSLIMDNVDTRLTLLVPNLTRLGEDLTVTGNDAVETVSLGDLNAVGGDLDISQNESTGAVSLGGLGTVAGDLTIEDNGDATVSLGSLDQVGHDATLESTGGGDFDIGTATFAGDVSIEANDHSGVTGSTAAGSTTITNSHPEATMTAAIPSGALDAAVPFAVTHIDPASLPPAAATGPGGEATTVDPVAAWRFDFTVPTLNQDASLTFEVQLDGLDPATRQDLLTALRSGAATLATKGDAPGGTYRAFPLCAGGSAPSADGCVAVTKLDSNGQPTSGTPAVVRFSGVVGHFSTWAVAVAEPLSSNAPSHPNASPPSNAFRFGKVRLNKRKRTASLAVKVPGPGSLSLGGKGIRGQRKAARAAGTVMLAVRPTGKAKRRLARGGKLTVRVAVTYRPSGGNPATKTRKIGLRRSRQG